MRLTQSQLFNLIRDNFTQCSHLRDTQEENAYSTADGKGKGVRLEIKSRRGKKYDTTLLERKKFLSNIDTEVFYYAVFSEVDSHLYIFNITEMADSLQWTTQKCKKNTDFGGRYNYVEKEVAYLDWSDAVFIASLKDANELVVRLDVENDKVQPEASCELSGVSVAKVGTSNELPSGSFTKIIEDMFGFYSCVLEKYYPTKEEAVKRTLLKSSLPTVVEKEIYKNNQYKQTNYTGYKLK